MIFNVYALFDEARNKFLNVTIEENDVIAKRNFLEQVGQSGHLMYIAKDITLYKLAEFNLETGLISQLPVNEVIARGTEYDKV